MSLFLAAKTPGTPSSRHSSFSTNHVATVDDVTGEPIPEWKRQVYLNKLKKQKEKEEEEQKNSVNYRTSRVLSLYVIRLTRDIS